MNEAALRTLTAAEACAELRATGRLENARVNELLSLGALAEGDVVRRPLQLVACHLAALEAAMTTFEAPVGLERCEVGAATWVSAFVLGGLTIRDGRFTGPFAFLYGGHNAPGAAVTLVDTTFHTRAAFVDDWFKGPFRLHRCAFRAGTNLLGNAHQPYANTFEVPPEVVDCSGRLDLDGE